MNIFSRLMLVVLLCLSAPLFGQAGASAQTGSAYGIGKPKLPSPRPGACVSEQELTSALTSSSCDCSCEGYARGPDRRCQVVCGLPYYFCWAPDPTDAETMSSFDALFEGLDAETRAPLELQMKAELRSKPQAMLDQRGILMMQRAAAWEDARRCTE